MSAAIDEIKEILRSKQFGKLFVGDTENTLIQFFRYCFVGGLATVVDWGASYLLFHFAFHDSHAVAANVISFVLGLLVNFAISKFWIFKSSKVENPLVEFLGFAGIGLVGLLITAGITKGFEVLLADTTSAYQILGKVVSTAISFLWNFFARKYILYNKK